MGITRLDHVNVRTARLDVMIAWYEDALGMATGPRPGFSFPGAWMYCGNDPVVHLVGVEDPPRAEAGDLRFEHFALSATGLKEFIDRLRAGGESFRPRRLDDFGVVQINVHDPDGNHIHIDFPVAEAEGAGL